MNTEIPVAAVVPAHAEGEDPVVVEADPQGSATRAMKSVARWVFRLVQELQWGGRGGAVVVAVAGDTSAPPPIGVNLALLVSPLLTTAVGERAGPTTSSVLLEPDDGEARGHATGRNAFASPRDRVWIVPEDRLADPHTRDLFDLVIFEPGPGDPLGHIDVCVVLTTRHSPEVAIPDGLPEAVEVGAVVVGSTEGDVPTSIRIAE